MPKVFSVQDFNGGMVDEVDNAQPRFCKRMRNMLLDASGKPYQRNGTVRWSVQLSTGERVSAIKVFRDFSNLSAMNNYTAFAYSHRKIWAATVPAAITEAAGPTTWTEITTGGAVTTAISAAQNVSVGTKCKMQAVNQAIYASFQNRDTYTGNDPRYHPRPRRIHPTGTSSWTLASVGIPNLPADPTFVGGGAGHNYVYYLVTKLTYIVNNVTFVLRGTPNGPYSATNIDTIDAGHTVAIGNIVRPLQFSGTFYDAIQFSSSSSLGVLQCEVYRTTDNGTVPKLVKTVTIATNATSTTTDNVADAALGAAIYTADGTAAYDYPPNCNLMHVVGDVAYYGGFTNGSTLFPGGYMGAMQSSPGVIESAPAAFTIATPDHLTAMESVDIYPIFFTRGACYRVEGQIDAYGNGNVNLRPISEEVGALRQSGVTKTDKGLLFASDDGIYFTDGFSIKKVTDHLNKFYRGLWNAHTSANLDDMAAVYHPQSKRYFYNSFISSGAHVTNSTIPNALIVGDLRHQTDEGGAATSYLQGEAVPAATEGYSFTPTALEVYRETLLMGDSLGYVHAIKIEPTSETGADIVCVDAGVDSAVAAASWTTVPIVWDYISPIFDLGNRVIKKWVPIFQITFKQKYPMTSVSAQVTSYNDGAWWSDTSSLGQTLKVIRKTGIAAYIRELTFRRFFKKGFIRCTSKQIQIKKAQVITYASIPAGVRAYTTATVAAAGPTASLSAGSWPDVTNQTIYFALDGYTQGFTVTTTTGGTAHLLDPGGLLVNGTYEWQVVGYPKDQSPAIESYSLAYDELNPGTQTMYKSSDLGSN